MTEKVERNGPCPCGSGKKFKKCCMKKGDGAWKLKKLKAKVLSSTDSALSSNVISQTKVPKAEDTKEVKPESSENQEA